MEEKWKLFTSTNNYESVKAAVNIFTASILPKLFPFFKTSVLGQAWGNFVAH
jgi:hypothetical protein